MNATGSRTSGASGRSVLIAGIVIPIYIRILFLTKFYPDGNCRNCHSEDSWSDVKFDHSKTSFALTGAHTRTGCRSCHFKTYSTGIFQQQFAGLQMHCADCHADRHRNQFARNGETNCTECHATDNWKATGFDHNKTAFKLDGQHVNVPCANAISLSRRDPILT